MEARTCKTMGSTQIDKKMKKDGVERRTGIESFINKDSTLKVLSLPVDDGGCGWYRVRQPFYKLRQHGLCDVHILDDRNESPEDLGRAIRDADVVVARPVLNTKFILFDSVWEIDPHKPIVFDIDDNNFTISPYSEHYVDFGQEDFTDEEGRKIWETGRNKFDKYLNQVRMVHFKRMLEQSTILSTTAHDIRNFYLNFNETVAILPNCINFEHWWRLPIKKTQEIRIMWHGGVSHYEDIAGVSGALQRILKRYPNTKLVMVGTHFPGLFKDIPEDRIEAYGWVPFHAHPYRMAALNPDIGICPIEDTPFNRAKSEIKYSEYAALGVPVVAKNIPPYSTVVKDGENGFTYGTEEEFEAKVSKLVEDALLRIDIGERGYRWVKANRDADQMVHLWYDTYLQLSEARKKLEDNG